MKKSYEHKPKFWGTWKGAIIKAIVDREEPLTWSEIKEQTQLETDPLYTAIGELLESKKIIYNAEEGVFRVIPKLYREYRKYLGKTDEITTRFKPAI